MFGPPKWVGLWAHNCLFHASASAGPLAEVPAPFSRWGVISEISQGWRNGLRYSTSAVTIPFGHWRASGNQHADRHSLPLETCDSNFFQSDISPPVCGDQNGDSGPTGDTGVLGRLLGSIGIDGLPRVNIIWRVKLLIWRTRSSRRPRFSDYSLRCMTSLSKQKSTQALPRVHQWSLFREIDTH